MAPHSFLSVDIFVSAVVVFVEEPTHRNLFTEWERFEVIGLKCLLLWRSRRKVQPLICTPYVHLRTVSHSLVSYNQPYGWERKLPLGNGLPPVFLRFVIEDGTETGELMEIKDLLHTAPNYSPLKKFFLYVTLSPTVERGNKLTNHSVS